MAKIKNTTPRIFNLPQRQQGKGPDAPVFGTALLIAPGATADVPDWYLAELKKERNWANRINDRGEIIQARRVGTIAPEDRERAERKRAAAQTSTSNEDLVRRVAELEAMLRNAAPAQAEI